MGPPTSQPRPCMKSSLQPFIALATLCMTVPSGGGHDRAPMASSTALDRLWCSWVLERDNSITGEDRTPSANVSCVKSLTCTWPSAVAGPSEDIHLKVILT